MRLLALHVLLLLPLIAHVVLAGTGSPSVLLDSSPWAAKTNCGGGGGEASVLVQTDPVEGSSAGLSRARTASSTGLANSDAPRPHIVVFVADDMGYNDCGGFSSPEAESGSPMGRLSPQTPIMDSLMRDGVRLKK